MIANVVEVLLETIVAEVEELAAREACLIFLALELEIERGTEIEIVTEIDIRLVKIKMTVINVLVVH